jgi:hypothetical protein
MNDESFHDGLGIMELSSADHYFPCYDHNDEPLLSYQTRKQHISFRDI